MKKRNKTAVALILCITMLISMVAVPTMKAEASYMPLEEVYGVLDLTGLTKYEMQGVTKADIISNVFGQNGEVLTIDGDIVAYKVGASVGMNNNYIPFNADWINLVEFYMGNAGQPVYYNKIELIVGKIDQLNVNNKRYILDIKETPWNPLFVDVRVDKDTYDSHLANVSFISDLLVWEKDRNNMGSWIDGKYTGRAVITNILFDEEISSCNEGYISFYPNPEFQNLSFKIYEGYFESVSDLEQEATDITSEIFKESLNSVAVGKLLPFF